MCEEREISVVLEGKGKTKQESFINAISFLQKKLTGEISGTVLRIEPLDVKFLEGKEIRSTEKFLFFFMKREVSNFIAKIEVKVRVFSVDHNGFHFKLVEKKNRIF